LSAQDTSEFSWTQITTIAVFHIRVCTNARLFEQGDRPSRFAPLIDQDASQRLSSRLLSKGGIIPDTAKEKPQEGHVVAVGSGKILEDGKLLPLELKAADKVLHQVLRERHQARRDRASYPTRERRRSRTDCQTRLNKRASPFNYTENVAFDRPA
jgi:co-chaperonin GroES (HSP10)